MVLVVPELGSCHETSSIVGFALSVVLTMHDDCDRIMKPEHALPQYLGQRFHVVIQRVVG